MSFRVKQWFFTFLDPSITFVDLMTQLKTQFIYCSTYFLEEGLGNGDGGSSLKGCLSLHISA